MRIDINRLISESAQAGRKVTKAQLARESVRKGLFKNYHSARTMLFYNSSGHAQSLDVDLINFLCEYFGRKQSEIITFDN